MLNPFVSLKGFGKNFSFFNSLCMLLSLKLIRTRVHIPTKKRVMYLRPDTKDRETFYEIFRSNLYGTTPPFYPRIIVDAGANIGLASLYFKLLYRDAKIAAIEIEQSNVDMMRKNLKGIDVKIYQNALYNKKAFFKIENPYHATNSFSIKEVSKEDEYDIESITIDEIMKENKWDHIDILKVDIEGAEKALFASDYESWLPHVKILMIETHDRMVPDCSYTVMQALHQYGFSLFTTTEGTLVYYSKEVMQLHH